MHDRDDKYEGSDDSEYHFSDDDVDYEAETDSSKPASVNEVHTDSGRSTGGSKRIIIGFVVFFGLVFIAYKMVSPTASDPSTDIAPQAQAPAPVVAAPEKQQMAQQQPAQQQSAKQSSTPVDQQAVQGSAPEQQSAIQQMQSMVVPQQEVDTVQQAPQQATSNAPATQPTSGQLATIPQSTPAPVNNAMPQMLPVQTSASAPTVMTPSVPSQAISSSADVASTSLAMENARLSTQLQAEYSQRISEYQSQNRNLQEQVQTLNSRVANMESEMNQLIQTLTQQFQGGSSAPAAQPAQPVEQAAPAPLPHVPYSVQAIIPGRAWLRAKNGDTVTVAEGDDIKGIGRVTKIDPYDGVVEINVQGRSVSLTYGNGS